MGFVDMRLEGLIICIRSHSEGEYPEIDLLLKTAL